MLELVCRRDQFKTPPPARERFDPTDDAALAEYQGVYRQRSTAAGAVGARPAAGEFATEIMIPRRLPRPVPRAAARRGREEPCTRLGELVCESQAPDSLGQPAGFQVGWALPTRLHQMQLRVLVGTAHPTFNELFHCDHCEQLIFFENVQCLECGHPLAFLPDLMDMGSFERTEEDGLWRSPAPAAEGRLYRACENYTQHNVCNWAVPADDPIPLCVSCRVTEVIPDLDRPGHKEAWYKLEVAKRRLAYSLVSLGLPISNRVDDPERGLAFEFKADPKEKDAPPVLTGHANGVITINIAEADDAEREAAAIGAARTVSHVAGPHAARSRALLLGPLDRRQRPAAVVSRTVRRRASRLWRVAEAALPARPSRRLASQADQHLCQR